MTHTSQNKTSEQGSGVPTSHSKSSLHSSTSSLSPSASVLVPSSPSSRNVTKRTSKTPVLSSSSNTRTTTKLDQILQNFYAKTAQIILQSRLKSQQGKEKGKLNKWFNIVTDDMPQLREELQYWKSAIKQQQQEALPMIIELFLEPTGREKRRIILERWSLSLRHPLPDFTVDLPNLYKRSLIFFRCLHSLVRILPCYNLHRRNVMSDECSLSYRLSTELTTTSNNEAEEIVSFDHPLNTNDKIKSFQFNEVITPLGTFKLDLSYRDYFPLENPPVLYDIEEDFFHQQDTARPVSSSSTKTTDFQRPISGGTITERRISVPSISPFKSISLSSSPQAEIMYPSRSQTPEKKLSDSISLTASCSLNRKKEFSSSFEKYKVNREPKRISRTASDHSSIHLESEEDNDLKEFMIFIGKKQDLKLFKTQQDSTGSSIMAESSSASSSLYGSDSIYKSKKALSHFKNIQEAHSVLSSSISIESNKEQQQQQQQQQQPQYPIQSYISSSSSTKSLNQPAVSSPLHTTESIVQTSSHEQQSPLKNKRSTSSLLRRPSSVDEDDSLVFKMSELGTTDDSIEKQKGKQPLKRQVDPPTCSKQHQSNL